MRLVTSAKGSVEQICRRYAHEKACQRYLKRPKSLVAERFMESILNRKSKEHIKLTEMKLFKEEEYFLEQNLQQGFNVTKLLECYNKSGLTFIGARNFKRSNSYVQFSDSSFGRIIRIFQANDSIYVTYEKIRTIKVFSSPLNLPVATRMVSLTKIICVIDGSMLQNLCVYTSVGDKKFLTPLCNKFEHT